MVVESIGYGAVSAESPMAPLKYQLREPKADDVLIEVAYCGICHSDIHTARSEWGPSKYPCVPGHEFTGHVAKVGSGVSKFKPGDRVAIGCLVNSCRECAACKRNLENYCGKCTFTYNSVDEDGNITYGGYGKYVVANQNYVLNVPETLPMDRSAPLLCAGITVYSPLITAGIDAGGYKIGVIGLGGLGHMALQFAAKMGNEVHVLSRSPGKLGLAKSLGATGLLTSDEDYSAHLESFDFLIDTVSAKKPMGKYLNLLKIDGTMIIVGLPPVDDPVALATFPLISKRRRIMGSMIGGIKETQDMLEYCAETGILPVVEMIRCDQIPEAYERVVKSDVQFRFVIDVKGSQPSI